jgi:hypothetical protein
MTVYAVAARVSSVLRLGACGRHLSMPPGDHTNSTLLWRQLGNARGRAIGDTRTVSAGGGPSDPGTLTNGQTAAGAHRCSFAASERGGVSTRQFPTMQLRSCS